MKLVFLGYKLEPRKPEFFQAAFIKTAEFGGSLQKTETTQPCTHCSAL